jgi:DNA-binding transcriptional LysR family regulator
MSGVVEAHERRLQQRSALRVDLIETFIVIAEERCLARAAERLYISPSGITRRLQALEMEYGRALVDRDGKMLGLTAAGHALLPHAEAIAAAAQAAAEAVLKAPDIQLVVQPLP